MLNIITDNIQAIGIGLALTVVLGIAIKKLPSLLEAKMEAALDRLFKEGDAADDAFIVAAINWAEVKYGPGSGGQKADAVVAKITALLPLPYKLYLTPKVRVKAVQLFQECFDRLEKVALEARSKAEPQK